MDKFRTVKFNINLLNNLIRWQAGKDGGICFDTLDGWRVFFAILEQVQDKNNSDVVKIDPDTPELLKRISSGRTNMSREKAKAAFIEFSKNGHEIDFIDKEGREITGNRKLITPDLNAPGFFVHPVFYRKAKTAKDYFFDVPKDFINKLIEESGKFNRKGRITAHVVLMAIYVFYMASHRSSYEKGENVRKITKKISNMKTLLRLEKYDKEGRQSLIRDTIRQGAEILKTLGILENYDMTSKEEITFFVVKGSTFFELYA